VPFGFEVKRFIWKEAMAYSYICGPETPGKC